MKLESKIEGDVVVLKPKGAFTESKDSDIFRDAVTGFVDKQFKKFIVDFAGLTEMNSLGLGTLLYAYTDVKKKGGELAAANVTDKIQSLLTITKLQTILSIFDNEKDAENYLKEFKP